MRAPLLGALLLLAAFSASAAPPRTKPDDGELIMAVALFRHGVRAPLEDLDDHRNSAGLWPNEGQWGAKWKHLTKHGTVAVTALGLYYAQHYRREWPNGFRAYLWADTSDRTRETADALGAGLQAPDIPVTVDGRPDGNDPVFHAFKAGVAKPDRAKLVPYVEAINRNAARWWNDYARTKATAQLRDVLACATRTPGCTPIDELADASATFCTEYSDKCESPIQWKGKFSAASTASEAFLLEYANDMKPELVGWNHVNPPAKSATSQMSTMLALHETYFDETQRTWYPAQVDGSNLIREIEATLTHAQGCQHAPRDAQFVGLIGHDTNLANVGALLGLEWQLGPSALFPETGRLPSNDALPAGALVFELRRLAGEDYVRIVYVAQTPKQSRDAAADAVRLNVSCRRLDSDKRDVVCRMPLAEFTKLARHAIAPEFLSPCPERASLRGGPGRLSW